MMTLIFKLILELYCQMYDFGFRDKNVSSDVSRIDKHSGAV